MELNIDQKESIKLILDFFKSSDKLFLLSGSAGTGKSTIITYLLTNKHFNDKKIALTATTNKAVSVLNKMVNCDLKNLTFLTIHRLLNFKRTIDESGNAIYFSNLENSNWELTKNTKNIYYYDIIIIDEASMINKQMLKNILFVSNKIKGKIILVGDDYQLPPINEVKSEVFSINIRKSRLDIIMRNKSSITGFANEIKKLIKNKNHKIKLKSFLNETFSASKSYEKWRNQYIVDYKAGNYPIMLAFTNNQCRLNNLEIRKTLFNTKDNYVIGELIVFNNYYKYNEISYYTSQQDIIKDISVKLVKINNIDFNELLNLRNLKVEVGIQKSNTQINCPICYEDSIDFTVETKCHHYFCETCINLWLKKNKECPYCRMSLVNSTNDVLIKDDLELTEKIKNLRNSTNDMTFKAYSIHLNEGYIMVIHEDDQKKYDKFVELIFQSLTNIKNYIQKNYLNNFSKILLNRLWEFYYNNLYDKFANISYGYCITTHKSQGSTFQNVYVDMKNIIDKNHDHNSKYKCLYTAVTRSANKLNIVI